MPSFKGITCNLLVDGRTSEEYAFEIVDDNTCKVHVEAIDDKEYGFDIDYRGTGAKRHDIRFSADGQRLLYGTRIDMFRREDYATLVGTNGDVDQRKLRFGKLITVDQKDEYNESRPNVLANIGTMEWKICRAKEDAPYTHYNGGGNAFQPIKPVHEKAIKGRGCTHHTDLGPSYTYPPVYRKTEPIDPHDKPYARFIFHYSSKELLQSAGLMPKPPPVDDVDEDVPKPTLEDSKNDTKKLEKTTEGRNLKREIIELSDDEPFEPSVIELSDDEQIETSVPKTKVVGNKRKKYRGASGGGAELSA